MVSGRFLLRVLGKGLVLFVLLNLITAGLPEAAWGRISGYNWLFPGRPRFPFGERPREAYNFSLNNLDAMFAAHELSQPKAPGEYRVLVLGDSSIWGTLLRPEETLAGQLNARELSAPDGRRMRFYNLGYPTLSLVKDLMILEKARSYQPDLMVWAVTLEALPADKQAAAPLVKNNPAGLARLEQAYPLGLVDAKPASPAFWQRTLVGRRKDLADLFRLQWHGVLWAATGVDQLYPSDYPRAQVDLEADPTFHGKDQWQESELAFPALDAGVEMLGGVPLLVVNEPILISTGKNSEIRYNFYYPRAVYDQYRRWMESRAQTAGYAYLDAWDLVPAQDFTNSAIHINARGVSRLADALAGAIQNAAAR